MGLITYYLDDPLLPKSVYGDAAYKQAFFLLSYRQGTDSLAFLGGGRLKPENDKSYKNKRDDALKFVKALKRR
ncbi:hypothetical protein NEOC84_000189|nr:hypothetical protein [Neochlamydia sp. AcF84]